MAKGRRAPRRSRDFCNVCFDTIFRYKEDVDEDPGTSCPNCDTFHHGMSTIEENTAEWVKQGKRKRDIPGIRENYKRNNADLVKYPDGFIPATEV